MRSGNRLGRQLSAPWALRAETAEDAFSAIAQMEAGLASRASPSTSVLSGSDDAGARFPAPNWRRASARTAKIFLQDAKLVMVSSAGTRWRARQEGPSRCWTPNSTSRCGSMSSWTVWCGSISLLPGGRIQARRPPIRPVPSCRPPPGPRTYAAGRGQQGTTRNSPSPCWQKAGHSVTLAANGVHEAVDAMRHGDFDVVLMDVQMPNWTASARRGKSAPWRRPRARCRSSP